MGKARAAKKYLVETSALRPILDDSTKAHNAHAAEAVSDGTIWASTYLRMEYIRRWICDAIRVAVTISLCESLSDALIVLEQDFKPRQIKGTIATLAKMLRENASLHNTRIAAEEVGSIAVRMLERYDHLFTKRIPDRSRCQVGGVSMDIDFDNMIEELRIFSLNFSKPVMDCEVDEFLNLRSRRSDVDLLMKDGKAAKLDTVITVGRYRADGTHITCKECVKIGDVIIGLEQPPRSLSEYCLQPMTFE